MDFRVEKKREGEPTAKGFRDQPPISHRRPGSAAKHSSGYDPLTYSTGSRGKEHPHAMGDVEPYGVGLCAPFLIADSAPHSWW